MRVNEIFYSLQGEGRFTGVPAVFLRLSGCNLRCPFCDTDHAGGSEMTEEAIVAEIAAYPARHVVITGGEPTLQLTASLVGRLHDAGKFVAIETNGTQALPDGLTDLIDWITLSPKFDVCRGADVRISRHDELKVVYNGQDMSAYEALARRSPGLCYLQPCDTGDAQRNAANTAETIGYIKAHPCWTLSLQTHKLLNIP